MIEDQQFTEAVRIGVALAREFAHELRDARLPGMKAVAKWVTITVTDT